MGDRPHRRAARVWIAGALGLALLAASLVVATGPAGAVAAADLSVTLSRSPVLGQAAVDPVTFTAVIHNNGPGAAQQVAFVDPLNEFYPLVQALSTTVGTCDSDDFQQITCAIGTLASGASATVTMRLLIGRPGLIENTVAVTSATADPDDDNNIASTSVVLSTPPSFEELVVTGYFKLVLGLDITDEQLAHWAPELDEYDYYDGDFALQLLKTYTFRSNWVNETFQKLLGRAPDAAALAVFTRQLSQRVTYDQIDATIAGSTEYYAKTGGTDEAFVTRLVGDFTGHPPTDAFRQELLDRLASGQSRTMVASRVVTSGLGRVSWVKWQYRRYYKREVTALEAHFALNAFRAGVRPARELANLLGGSEIIESFVPGYYYEYEASGGSKAV